MTTDDKLALLRQAMREQGLAAYYVNTADYHQSEYIGEAFRTRAWLTGFTGSAGYALVTMDRALLWTDGRYFIQADRQISGSEFELMKLSTPGYPSLEQWVLEHLPEGSLLGLNGQLISEQAYTTMAQKFASKKIGLRADLSLVEDIWQDRPDLPTAEVFCHALQYTGQTAKQKIDRVRQHLADCEAGGAFYLRLDDICWLFNIRGGDVPANPVTLSFAYISPDRAVLFIDRRKLNEDVTAYLTGEDIECLDYFAVADFLAGLKSQEVKRLVLDKKVISHQLFSQIDPAIEIIDETDYPKLQKAVLNKVELTNQKHCYLKDSTALVKFIYWVKQNIGQMDLDELNTADKLLSLRQEQELFFEPSFTSISAYGPNAAMMHYSATQDNYSRLEAKGFYLIDSGGQYLDGTTDITRTLSLGPLTDQEKRDYTLTLKSHIALARAKFLAGTNGYYLDALARQPLWQDLLDYKCGTGHAVGYVLGVHEGPHRISKVYNDIALVPGMLVTNEPGVYREGLHGIRLENDLIVIEAGENMGDSFYQFETISLVPFDRQAIIPDLLTTDELAWLKEYNREILNKIGPRLDAAELAWLESEVSDFC